MAEGHGTVAPRAARQPRLAISKESFGAPIVCSTTICYNSVLNLQATLAMLPGVSRVPCHLELGKRTRAPDAEGLPGRR